MTIDKMCVSAQTFCQSGDRNSSSSLRRNLTAIKAIFNDLLAITILVSSNTITEVSKFPFDTRVSPRHSSKWLWRSFTFNPIQKVMSRSCTDTSGPRGPINGKLGP